MPRVTVSEAEKDIIRRCLITILEGPFIDDWEFGIRLGFDRAALVAMLSVPFDVDSMDPLTQLAINNCMNEIVNGINLSPAQWDQWFVIPKEDVERTFLKWTVRNAV